MALWMPPPHLSHGQLFAWLLTCILLFRFSHSLYMVPSGALLPELAPDYHDRTALYGYRYMLGTVAALPPGFSPTASSCSGRLPTRWANSIPRAIRPWRSRSGSL